MYQTYRFMVEIDAPCGWRNRSIASAIRTAIEYVSKNDVAGTELLDGSVTRADVAVCDGSREPINVIVGVDGGVVQGASANHRDVGVTIVDYDTEGAEKAELVPVPQSDGSGPCDAYVSNFVADHDPEWVERVLDARRQEAEAT